MSDTGIATGLRDLLESRDKGELIQRMSRHLAHTGFWGFFQKTLRPSPEGGLSPTPFEVLSGNLETVLGHASSDCATAVTCAVGGLDPRLRQERMTWLASRTVPFLSLEDIPRRFSASRAVLGVFEDFGFPARDFLVTPVSRGETRSEAIVAIPDSKPSVQDIGAAISLARIYDHMSETLEAGRGLSDALAPPDRGIDRAVELTEKQLKVLSWAAAGKTLQEIADIEGISRRTVRYHIEGARERYGYATTQQTIVRAALDHDFDPLGPDRRTLVADSSGLRNRASNEWAQQHGDGKAAPATSGSVATTPAAPEHRSDPSRAGKRCSDPTE